MGKLIYLNTLHTCPRDIELYHSLKKQGLPNRLSNQQKLHPNVQIC